VSLADDWFDTHLPRLDDAVRATETRGWYTPFVESPSRRHWPEGAKAAGAEAFEAVCGSDLSLGLPGAVGWLGTETSPFTGQPLGVRYETVDPQRLVDAVGVAWPAWREATARQRVGVCLQILHELAADTFLHAHATHHTAGQPFVMAFAGSGANSLDRGLEALAMAWRAMAWVPSEATFARSFGRGAPVTLHKRFRLVPRGVAVVLACGTYPAWNAWPALFANLATGNPVVLKPHPDTVLPVALAVRTCRRVLAEAGFPADLVTLAVDTWEAPITRQLLEHPLVQIVDFTGGQTFGCWLEEHARQQVYSETAGCNAVVLHSATDLDAALRAVAHSLCCFSGQMCTKAQNVWLGAEGVYDGDELVPPDEVMRRLVDAIDAWVADPEQALAVCGAVHSPRTLDALRAVSEPPPGGEVLRAWSPIEGADPARTATPVLVRLEPSHREVYGREHFGPIGFVMVADSFDDALARAATDAKERGSIASYGYAVQPDALEAIEEAFALAGASVGINLVRQLPINYAAAYSDFHVTGLNPAGTATLSDLAFVADRFRVVQSKVELPLP
jgi:phenylacetic acid degradation protein paaN